MMLEAIKWLAVSFLGLIAVYVLFRVMSRAAFTSWFEVKKEHETKKGEKE